MAEPRPTVLPLSDLVGWSDDDQSTALTVFANTYASFGAETVDRGIYQPHQVSADVIRIWISQNPEDGSDLFWTNRSYVFFREVSDIPVNEGLLGPMNRSITPLRTLAVDPAIVPLGAPVRIEKAGEVPMNRRMIAQDTGSAIKGAQRADTFYGTASQASRIPDRGRMVVLLPIQLAHAMTPDVQGDTSPLAVS
jgi:membrane-bound lytic murein transglycosylase A